MGRGTLRSMAQSAGVSDSALKAERSTEIAIVKANCLYMLPTKPPSRATGTNTAERMRAIPITGAETSSMALMVASLGCIPCSRWWITASTTTMASSTTIPMASTKPNMERVFREKPKVGKKIKVPMSDTGMVIRGIIVARMFCRKMNTTSVTRISASTNVFRIS